MIKKVFSFILSLSWGVCCQVCCFSPVSEVYYSDTYSGNGEGAISHTETINFDDYSLYDVHLNLLFPEYSSSYGNNACAPTAGAMLVTYHDITYTNLIPNYVPGAYTNGKYKYRAQNSTINSLMETLYNLMGTNSIQDGTSVNQFKNGLTSYYNSNGYTTSYVQYSSPFNKDTAISYINLQHPIVLFLNSYDYYPGFGVSINENQMTMTGYTKTVGHVVVAYGYQEYNFYQNNSIFRTDKYLIVSFGDGTSGYLAINNTTCINEAYSVIVQ